MASRSKTKACRERTAEMKEGESAGAQGRAGDQDAKERALRPSECREYMRRVLAREFRGIVQGFVQEARSGSCQHVKLATELVNAPPARRRKKGTLHQIWDEIERDRKRQAEASARGEAGPS